MLRYLTTIVKVFQREGFKNKKRKDCYANFKTRVDSKV